MAWVPDELRPQRPMGFGDLILRLVAMRHPPPPVQLASSPPLPRSGGRRPHPTARAWIGWPRRSLRPPGDIGGAHARARLPRDQRLQRSRPSFLACGNMSDPMACGVPMAQRGRRRDPSTPSAPVSAQSHSLRSPSRAFVLERIPPRVDSHPKAILHFHLWCCALCRRRVVRYGARFVP